MQIETGLVLGDCPSREVAFATHRPDRWQDINVFGDLIAADEFPVLTVDVAVDFFHNGFNKLARVRLSNSLMEIHDVAHHLG
jgi:hypothetical protein